MSELDLSKVAMLRQRDLNRVIKNAKLSAALLCFYYPQYRFEEALELPAGDVQLLLSAVRNERLSEAILALNIATAAGNKKGYDKLMKILVKEQKSVESSI